MIEDDKGQEDDVPGDTNVDGHMLLTRIGGDSDRLLTDFEGSAFIASSSLFDAWVPQPSPCCAAAVMAGVLNALTPSSRWGPKDVLPYYMAMTDQRIKKQKKKLLVMLRLESMTEGELDALTDAVRDKLHTKHELHFGDTSKKAKQNKLNKKLLLDLARECVMAEHSIGLSSAVIQTIFPPGGDNLADEACASEMTVPEIPSTPHSQGSGGTSFDVSFSTRSSKKAHLPRWKQIQQELYEYWHLLDGRAKLGHPNRPSTAICGNAALLFAVEAITKQEPERVFGSTGGSLRGELFVGRAPGTVRHSIKDVEDPDEMRNATWIQLWTALSSDQTVLVFHMRNHYALIFALREWRSSDDQVHRELLTSRRGQRPSTWICWKEAYNTMAAWHGYKILRFTSVLDAKPSL